MAKLHLRYERRGVDRPLNGEKRICPKCRRMTFEFNERFRLPVRTQKMKALPAWMCDRPTCRFVKFARRKDRVRYN